MTDAPTSAQHRPELHRPAVRAPLAMLRELDDWMVAQGVPKTHAMRAKLAATLQGYCEAPEPFSKVQELASDVWDLSFLILANGARATQIADAHGLGEDIELELSRLAKLANAMADGIASRLVELSDAGRSGAFYVKG